MNRFDKNNLQEIRREFAEAVKGLESKYGIKFSMGNISYTEFEFKTRLVCNRIDTSDVVQRPIISNSVHARANQRAKYDGVKYNGENFIGTIWEMGSRKLRVTKLNNRNYKNCWELVDVNTGQESKAPSGFFKRSDLRQSHVISII